jgi:hypothetical protein
MSNAHAQPEPRSPGPVATEPSAEQPQTTPEVERNAPPDDNNELRCTLCGLRACWTG